MIHGDLHHHNFILSGNELTLIDFGDSEYHWFAYDIAVAIYHVAQAEQMRPDRQEFIKSFFNSFMSGYSRGNSVTEFISQIDYFIDYRHLFSYTYHSLYSDKSQLTEQQLKYLDEMRLSLIKESSFLGFSLL
ncbi:phosphotransferase [Paenibacillus terrigena]|uniref:phosphotransferase n=1 Tax=Paenibacillus terrigena TaxID=369333 RepID=UPI00037AEDA4